MKIVLLEIKVWILIKLIVLLISLLKSNKVYQVKIRVYFNRVLIINSKSNLYKDLLLNNSWVGEFYLREIFN
jgi:hypothetical protein